MNLKKAVVFKSRYALTVWEGRRTHLGSGKNQVRTVEGGDFTEALEVFYVEKYEGEIPEILFASWIGAFKENLEDVDNDVFRKYLEMYEKDDYVYVDFDFMARVIRLIVGKRFHAEKEIEEALLRTISIVISRAEKKLDDGIAFQQEIEYKLKCLDWPDGEFILYRLTLHQLEVMYFTEKSELVEELLEEKLSELEINELLPAMREKYGDKIIDDTVYHRQVKRCGWGWDEEPATKKEYAEKVASELGLRGLNSQQAWEVIRAAGPGSVGKALRYAEALIADGVNPDLIWLLFGGANGSKETYGCGWERTKAAIKVAGIKVPFVRDSVREGSIFSSAGEFFRVLKGTRLLSHFLSKSKVSLTA